jgi:hypothetical protein
MTTNTSHGLGMNIITLEYKYITYCFKNHVTHTHLFGLLVFWAGDTNGITFVECGEELHTLMHYLNVVISISVLVEITVSCSPKEAEALQKNKFQQLL